MAHKFSIKSLLEENVIPALGSRIGRNFPGCSYAGVEGDEVFPFAHAGRALAWLLDKSASPRLLIVVPFNWRPKKGDPALEQVSAVRRGEIRPNGRVIIDEPEVP